MEKTYHPQVWSDVVGAKVDEGMVDILEWLTRHGVTTIFSCQGREPDEDRPDGTDAYVMTEAKDFPFINELMKVTPEMNYSRIPSSAAVRGEKEGECLIFNIDRYHLLAVIRRWESLGVSHFASTSLMG